MWDGRDVRHVTDEDGRFWLTDADGNPVRFANGDRVPGPARPQKTTSGFTTYDTSQGHCGLCGSLTCRGSCFK